MSAFLGPIHFWLYNKIQFQENLIDELVAYVTAKGWSDKADQYVSTDRRKLDEVIDEANIHGCSQLWRQTGPSGRNGTGSLPSPR